MVVVVVVVAVVVAGGRGGGIVSFLGWPIYRGYISFRRCSRQCVVVQVFQMFRAGASTTEWIQCSLGRIPGKRLRAQDPRNVRVRRRLFKFSLYTWQQNWGGGRG